MDRAEKLQVLQIAATLVAKNARAVESGQVGAVAGALAAKKNAWGDEAALRDAVQVTLKVLKDPKAWALTTEGPGNS